MDLLENKYDRFVRIPSFKVKAGDLRDLDDIPEFVQHSIDLELETYQYHAKRQGHEQVVIKGEAQKLKRLRDEGRLDVSPDAVVLARYEYEPRPNRRDPFMDPRLDLPENSRIPEEERRQQLRTLDELKTELQAIAEVISQEKSEENVVKRVQLVDKNNHRLATFGSKVKGLHDSNFFSVNDYAKEFESLVRNPLEVLLSERDQVVPEMTIPTEDVEERLAKMEEAMAAFDWPQVIRLNDEIRQIRERFTVPAALEGLFTRASKMQREASARQKFEGIELEFGGCVTYRDDPKAAVVIINGRSFGPTEVVAEGLVIKEINASVVTFEYQGYEVKRRHESR